MFVPSANIVQEEYKAINTPFTKTLAFFLFLIKFFLFSSKVLYSFWVTVSTAFFFCLIYIFSPNRKMALYLSRWICAFLRYAPRTHTSNFPGKRNDTKEKRRQVSPYFVLLLFKTTTTTATTTTSIFHKGL